MNLTDIKEKDLLKEWASSHASPEITKAILSGINTESESYWTTCDTSEENIIEYGFDTMDELQKQLEHLLSDEIFRDIHTRLTVSAFKLRQLSQRPQHESSEDDGENPNFVIPDFVYNF